MNAFVFVCVCTCVWWLARGHGRNGRVVCWCFECVYVYDCVRGSVCVGRYPCMCYNVSMDVCMEYAVIMCVRMNECGRWHATLYVCKCMRVSAHVAHVCVDCEYHSARPTHVCV